MKRQLTEIQSERENSAVMQESSASTNPALHSRFLFPKEVDLHNGQWDNIRKPPRVFRADSRVSNSGGQKCARSFSTAKMVAETQRLRELEGDVYHMMGGAIRRKRYLESEKPDAPLEV